VPFAATLAGLAATVIDPAPAVVCVIVAVPPVALVLSVALIVQKPLVDDAV
jgi:hypothetical protein